MKKLFTQENKTRAAIELTTLVNHAIDELYTDNIADIQVIVKAELDKAKDKLADLMQDPTVASINYLQHHDAIIKTIVDAYADPKDRADAYAAHNLTRLTVNLEAILSSKLKLRSVARKTLSKLIELELGVKQGNKPTLSQLISACPLKVDTILDRPADEFDQAELKYQFITLLADLDYLDMEVADKTHMVSVPHKLASLLPNDMWAHMNELSMFVNTKSIYTSPITLDHKNLITRSSWYYKTPELTETELEYMNHMNSIKYQFVDNAEDLIESTYLEHLKDEQGQLPQGYEKWVPSRIAFFKKQIRESHANGGHYIMHRWDSSKRTYMMAEIGHKQSSPALRSLVKVADMSNPIKKDFRNNVVQMYSLIMRVKGLGKYVGLTSDSESDIDLRLKIADTLNSKLEVDIFCKDNIKPLFMVWAYNAGRDRILDGVTSTEAQLFGDATVNVKVPGLIALTGAKNDKKNRAILWQAFEETVTELVPAIVILKQVFKKLIKANPLTETSWTLPDGSVAQYASPDTKSNELYCVDLSGRQHQQLHHIKLISENVKSAGLLPRVIHSFDAWVARQLVVRAARLGITIIPNHDSFMFDAQHEATVDSLVQELFLELLNSNYFSQVINELNKAGKSLAVKDRKGDCITNEMLWSAYGKLEDSDVLAGRPMDFEDL
jgi:hypothetical protein